MILRSKSIDLIKLEEIPILKTEFCDLILFFVFIYFFYKVHFIPVILTWWVRDFSVNASQLK